MTLKKIELKAGSFEGSVVIPVKFLSLLKPFLKKDESLSLQIGENHVMINLDGVRVSSRIIKDRYPDYESVIPKDNESELTINKNDLQGSVKRVSIFSNKTTHQIRLKIAGAELNISAEDIDYSNKAEERLTCSYQGDDMQIGFNSRFLTEMLNNLSSDEVSLEMSLPNRAGILTPVDGLDDGESVTMLVMPVMLNS